MVWVYFDEDFRVRTEADFSRGSTLWCYRSNDVYLQAKQVALRSEEARMREIPWLERQLHFTPFGVRFLGIVQHTCTIPILAPLDQLYILPAMF